MGLFYPSSKELTDKAKESKLFDRRLSSCSPGNGYWRQQIDYIAAHLKVWSIIFTFNFKVLVSFSWLSNTLCIFQTYAYNNLEFRNLVRELRIRSLLYVRLKEMESGCLNIHMSFTLEDGGWLLLILVDLRTTTFHERLFMGVKSTFPHYLCRICMPSFI